MPDRCRDHVQHPNQPRPTAAEAAVENDEEAHAFYHHTHPPGYELLVLGFPANCEEGDKGRPWCSCAPPYSATAGVG